MKNAKHRKAVPGNSLNCPKTKKILASKFRSKNYVFPKCTFLGPQLSRRGLVWYLLNSSKAHAPRGRPGNFTQRPAVTVVTFKMSDHGLIPYVNK